MKKVHVASKALVYMLCLIFLIISVMLRQKVINRQRGATPVSYISEINKHGKPVMVASVKSKVFNVKKKFTIVPLEEKKFEGYVTREMASSLKVGQPVNALNGNSSITGKISHLSTEVDMMSGLYYLEVEFERPVICDSGKLLVETKVGEQRNIIEVPNDVLQTDNGRFFLWKIIDGKAYRKEVELSDRSGYSSIVKTGLNKEDVFVVTGQSQLENGDRVRIMKHND
jgi:HlyD family secretion protein